jgi:hypothetical protein
METITPKAANLKSIFWATKKGVAYFESQRVYGILNAAGTHALWSNKNQQPMTWGTMQTTKEIAQYAEAMAEGEKSSWVQVYLSKSEVPR